MRVETFTVVVKGDGRESKQQSYWNPHGTQVGEIFDVSKAKLADPENNRPTPPPSPAPMCWLTTAVAD